MTTPKEEFAADKYVTAIMMTMIKCADMVCQQLYSTDVHNIGEYKRGTEAEIAEAAARIMQEADISTETDMAGHE